MTDRKTNSRHRFEPMTLRMGSNYTIEGNVTTSSASSTISVYLDPPKPTNDDLLAWLEDAGTEDDVDLL